MRRFLKYFKTSLAVRTASIILLMVVVIGVVFLVVAVQVTKSEERAQQIERLEGLLDTVHSTVSIATFLRDRELASEVVAGLLQNPTVQASRIHAGEEVIAEGSDGQWPAEEASNAIVRDIESPFSDEIVGRIALVPNQSEIRAEVAQATRYTSLLFTTLLVLIGIGIVLVVIRMITRPIVRISNRLHGLRAETGEKLDLPRGSETDEIGRLVTDVNALIDHLVSRLKVEKDLRVEREVAEKRFRTIFENAESGIFLLDESGSVVSYNPAFARMFDLPLEGLMDGPAPLLPELIGEPEEGEGVDAFLRRCRETDAPEGMDFPLFSPSGLRTGWVHVVLRPVEGGQLQGVVNDITKRRQSEEAAKELAVTDALTGLENRLGFERRLESMVALCERHSDHQFSLLMLDLDHFKQANDTYGHHAGDLVLKEIARLLQNKTRKTDLVARLGGDEFVILLDGTTDRKSIEKIADTLIQAINAPIKVGEESRVQVGASIGIARYATGAAEPATLVRQADAAMYRAKLAGRNTYRFEADAESEKA